MIKGIIFDMDGTILNTIDDLAVAVNHALKVHQFPEVTVDEVKQAVGSGAMTLIETVVPKGTSKLKLNEVFRTYQDYYDTHNRVHTKPYPGIMDLLENLKDQGYKLAVVSNKYRYLVEKLNHELFKDMFLVSMGDTEGIKIKPEPDMLYMVLDELGLKKKDVLFIGDSDVDMQTALNANITSVGVTWGYRSIDVLKAYKASYIIDQADQLLKIIEEVNQNGND